MRSPVESVFETDNDGNPAGGWTRAEGIDIRWQHGTVGANLHNGAFIEDVIEVGIQRLRFFQASRFRCRENALAITKLEEALHWLGHRTQVREEQGVEDSYRVHTDPDVNPEIPDKG